MAVTYKGNMVLFGAQADAITGQKFIQAATLDHSAAANATLTDTAGTAFCTLRVGAGLAPDRMYFDPPIKVDGVIASALSAGVLRIYLA